MNGKRWSDLRSIEWINDEGRNALTSIKIDGRSRIEYFEFFVSG